MPMPKPNTGKGVEGTVTDLAQRGFSHPSSTRHREKDGDLPRRRKGKGRVKKRQPMFPDAGVKDKRKSDAITFVQFFGLWHVNDKCQLN